MSLLAERLYRTGPVYAARYLAARVSSAAVAIIEWFAEEGTRIYGRIVPLRHLGAQQQILKHQIGPVAAFTP